MVDFLFVDLPNHFVLVRNKIYRTGKYCFWVFKIPLLCFFFVFFFVVLSTINFVTSFIRNTWELKKTSFWDYIMLCLCINMYVEYIFYINIFVFITEIIYFLKSKFLFLFLLNRKACRKLCSYGQILYFSFYDINFYDPNFHFIIGTLKNVTLLCLHFTQFLVFHFNCFLVCKKWIGHGAGCF